MLRTPPHILVTTPESLYLLLTAERSREMLRTARTIIVDEIHAVIGTRRGAHLALSLERLQQLPGSRCCGSVCRRRRSRSKKSGSFWSESAFGNPIRVVDEGHRRAMDLDLELPGSPLER
jgi:ATP-dependent Lhr-like helicase